MSFRFFDDQAIADVAFEATGRTLPELFTAAACATINTMVEDLTEIRPRVTREVCLRESQIDLLLFEFLQEFIYHKDLAQLLLLVDGITIDSSEDGFHLSACLKGEKLDPSRHEQRADVKAVTLHRFTVEPEQNGWRCYVILDV